MAAQDEMFDGRVVERGAARLRPLEGLKVVATQGLAALENDASAPAERHTDGSRMPHRSHTIFVAERQTRSRSHTPQSHRREHLRQLRHLCLETFQQLRRSLANVPRHMQRVNCNIRVRLGPARDLLRAHPRMITEVHAGLAKCRWRQRTALRMASELIPDPRNARLAQLDRALVSEAEGHRFDSCTAHTSTCS